MSTATAIEMVKSTSKIEDGRGTMIMARIAITKRTTLRSRCPSKKLRPVPICCLVVNFLFAKLFFYHSIHLLKYQQEKVLLKKSLFCLAIYAKMARLSRSELYWKDSHA